MLGLEVYHSIGKPFPSERETSQALQSMTVILLRIGIETPVGMKIPSSSWIIETANISPSHVDTARCYTTEHPTRPVCI